MIILVSLCPHTKSPWYYRPYSSRQSNWVYSEPEMEMRWAHVKIWQWFMRKGGVVIISFHMRKLKLREVKLLAGVTQLGSGRGWIWTQMFSSLLLGAAWDLKAASIVVEETLTQKNKDAYNILSAYVLPGSRLKTYGFLFFMLWVITWAANWDICCEDVFLVDKLSMLDV